MRKIMLSVVLTGALFALCGYIGLPECDATAAGFDLYDYFTEEHIKVYEEEIAKTKVVSNLSDAQLAKTAVNYDVSVDKLRKMLIFQHAMKSAGYEYSLSQISFMNNGDLFNNGRKYVEWLKTQMSEEELKALGQKFKTVIGGN